MAKKYYLINFLLILIVVFLVVENYNEWTKPAPVAKETTSSKQKPAVLTASSSAAGKKEAPAPALFKSVSDKNIFSPDRKEFPIPLVSEAAKKAPPPPVRPNVQLFGVAVGEQYHSAIISNPTRRGDRGERDTITVKQGDRVGEYRVAKIVEDRVTLESSGDSFDVLLYDPSKQKKRPVVATTPSPAPVQPPSVPPRPYTPSAGATSPPAGSPAVVNPPPPPQQPGVIPGRNVGRSAIQRRVPAPRPSPVSPPSPAPPARTAPVPVPDEDDDDDDDEI